MSASTVHTPEAAAAMLAKYAEAVVARLAACKARTAKLAVAPLAPPSLGDGYHIYGRVFSTMDLATKTHVHNVDMDWCYVFGEDALPILGSCDGLWDMYRRLGIPVDRLADKLLADGNISALLLLPLRPDSPLAPSSATWDGIADLLDRTYPRVAHVVKPHLAAFATGGRDLFAALETGVPADAPQRFVPSDGRPWGYWACLSKEGRSKGAYVGYAELCAIVDGGGCSGGASAAPAGCDGGVVGGGAAAAPAAATIPAWLARLFLYCQLRLTGEFTGDGRTAAADDSGAVGPSEYLLPNAPLIAVREAGGVIVDLSAVIDMPESVLRQFAHLPYAHRYLPAGGLGDAGVVQAAAGTAAAAALGSS